MPSAGLPGYDSLDVPLHSLERPKRYFPDSLLRPFISLAKRWPDGLRGCHRLAAMPGAVTGTEGTPGELGRVPACKETSA